MQFEPIATGFCFLEGPRADADGLWFSDLLGGGLHRWRPGGVERYLPGTQHIGGIALNADGAIIFGSRAGLSWFNPQTGASAPFTTAAGAALPAANDMLPDGKGGIIFGTVEDPSEIPRNALYRFSADRHLTKLTEGLKFANGIAISPDGSRLYHNESLVGTFAYDILEDGGLGEKQLFYPQPDVDGLALDAEGNLWIAYYDSGAVQVVSPQGRLLQSFALPHKVVVSLCFGGADWRDLYVVTGGRNGVEAMLAGEPPAREAAIFHARTEIPGLPVPRTAFRLGQ